MQFKSSVLFVSFCICSFSTLVSAQQVASNDQIHVQDVELARRAKSENTSTTSTGTSSASSNADSSSTNSKSTSTTTTHSGGNNGLPFASPAILENGTLFYIALSATCLLWVTGKAIDVAAERLDKYAQTTTHKI